MTYPLLPNPGALCLDAIALQAGSIVFQVRTLADAATCPHCDWRSGRVHSHYQRTLQDLPWQGNQVCFRVTVRRSFCDNRVCTRKTTITGGFQAGPHGNRRFLPERMPIARYTRRDMDQDCRQQGNHPRDKSATRDLLTVEQAAQYLQLSASSIRSYIRQGKLKAFRVAGLRKVLIARPELLALLEPAISSNAQRPAA